MPTIEFVDASEGREIKIIKNNRLIPDDVILTTPAELIVGRWNLIGLYLGQVYMLVLCQPTHDLGFLQNKIHGVYDNWFATSCNTHY